MKLPFKITRFLGRGYCASTFKVEYEGQEVAMKIPYYTKRRQPSFDLSRKEYLMLEILSSVNNVPNPIRLLNLPTGTYEELGLDACGEPLEEVVHPSFLKNGVVFRGGFLMDYIESDLIIRPVTVFDVELTEEQRSYRFEESFFSRLEEVTREVHQEGYTVPNDATIMVKGQEPYLIDWTGAKSLSDLSPAGQQEHRDDNFEKVQRLKRILRGEEC